MHLTVLKKTLIKFNRLSHTSYNWALQNTLKRNNTFHILMKWRIGEPCQTNLPNTKMQEIDTVAFLRIDMSRSIGTHVQHLRQPHRSLIQGLKSYLNSLWDSMPEYFWCGILNFLLHSAECKVLVPIDNFQNMSPIIYHYI